MARDRFRERHMEGAVYDAERLVCLGGVCRSENRRDCVDDERQPRMRRAAQALPHRRTEGTTLAGSDSAGQPPRAPTELAEEPAGGGSGDTEARRVCPRLLLREGRVPRAVGSDGGGDKRLRDARLNRARCDRRKGNADCRPPNGYRVQVCAAFGASPATSGWASPLRRLQGQQLRCAARTQPSCAAGDVGREGEWWPSRPQS